MQNVHQSLQRTIVFTELDALVHRNILITEEDNSTLSSQQGEIVLLLLRQLAQLDSVHFCADMRRQVKDLVGVVIDGSLLGVSTMARIVVLKRLDLGILNNICT